VGRRHLPPCRRELQTALAVKQSTPVFEEGAGMGCDGHGQGRVLALASWLFHLDTGPPVDTRVSGPRQHRAARVVHARTRTRTLTPYCPQPKEAQPLSQLDIRLI
jgi:hypothetical protein